MERGLPCARQEGLLSNELPDGLIVYDTERHRAYALNQAAALVWRHCDGQTGVPEFAALLRQHELPSDEEVVWLALDHLGKAHLLQERQVGPGTQISRRQVMKKLGVVGGVATLLPLVESIIVPSPAQATSNPATTTSGAVSGEKGKGLLISVEKGKSASKGKR